MSLRRFAPTDYETDDEGNRRLSNTVVMIDDAPVRVIEVRQGVVYYITLNRDGRARADDYLKVPMNSPRLNALNLPVGYINLEKFGEAVYSRRRPIRNGLQGIRHGNFRADQLKNADPYAPPLDFNTIIRDPGFTAMMRNEYPSHEEALARMNANPKLASVAFHRRLSLQRDRPGFPMYICYRGKQTAWMSGTDVVLPEEMNYVREVLVENKVISNYG